MIAARAAVPGSSGPSGRRLRCFQRVTRVLGLATLGLLTVAALTPIVEWLATRYAEPARIAPADAIVVLGGDFRPDGWLDTASCAAWSTGIALYRQGLAPLLVLSGSTPEGRPVGARGPRAARAGTGRPARRDPPRDRREHDARGGACGSEPRSGRGACGPSCS